MEDLINATVEQEAEIFRAFADPTRLRLVKLLCTQGSPDALCVNALAARLGVTQSAVSQHLRVLKAIRLVKGERRGYHVHYSIDVQGLERCRTLVEQAFEHVPASHGEDCHHDCPNRREHRVPHG